MQNKFEKIFLNNNIEDLLAQAADRGKFDNVLSILQKNKVDINLPIAHSNKYIYSDEVFTGYKTTALHCAASQGHYKIVELLIDKNAHDLGRLLFIAATNNHLEIAELLIKRGADVNYIYRDEDSCILHELAYYDYVEMLELLIRHGANVNLSETIYDGTRTPLIKSIFLNNKVNSDDINKFTKYLLEYPITEINYEIIQPVLESYINESKIKIIEDVTKCEILYKQSNLDELFRFFHSCNSNVQNIFLKRQENKFNPKINYFKNKEDIYREAKKLEKFVSNDFSNLNLKPLETLISQYYDKNFFTLKGLTLLKIKSSDIEYKDASLPKSLIKDLDNCINIEDEVTITGDL